MRNSIIRIIVTGTFVFIMMVLIGKFAVVKESLREHFWEFLLIALIYIAGRWLDGARFRILVAHYGLKLTRSECFGLSVLYPFYNHVFPNAGLVTNAQYLKAKYGFRFSHFISVGLLRVATTIVTCSVIGALAGAIYMIKHRTLVLAAPVAVYLALMAGVFLVFFVPLPAFLKKFKFSDKLHEALQGVKDMGAKKPLMLELACFQTGIVLLFLFRYYVIFRALSLEAPFLNVAAIIPMTGLSNLINLIPANLGIREAVISASSLLIGYSLGDGMLVASVDRAVIVLSLLLVGSWFFVRLKYYNMGIVKNAGTEGTGSA